MLLHSSRLDHFKLSTQFSKHIFCLSVFFLALACAIEHAGDNALIFAEQACVEFTISTDFHFEIVVEIFKLISLSALLSEVILKGFARCLQIFNDLVKASNILTVAKLSILIRSNEGGKPLLILESIDFLKLSILLGQYII